MSAAQRANELLDKGQKEFAEGRYLDAIDTLRAGYVLSSQPRFLYAIGQAYRMNHQCKQAVQFYREFIRAEPARSQLAGAEANILRCGEEDPASQTEPTPPTPVPSQVQASHAPGDSLVAAVPPLRSERRSRPLYKRWWPWTIMTVGIVGVGLGLGLGLGLRRPVAPFTTTLPEVGPNAHH